MAVKKRKIRPLIVPLTASASPRSCLSCTCFSFSSISWRSFSPLHATFSLSSFIVSSFLSMLIRMVIADDGAVAPRLDGDGDRPLLFGAVAVSILRPNARSEFAETRSRTSLESISGNEAAVLGGDSSTPLVIGFGVHWAMSPWSPEHRLQLVLRTLFAYRRSEMAWSRLELRVED